MKKKSSFRNPFITALKKSNKGGRHRSKKDKRKSGKNKERDYLNDQEY